MEQTWIDSATGVLWVSREKGITIVAPRRLGWLWVCTQKGLCPYQPASRRFQRIPNSKDELWRMVVDKPGNIWVKASEGLFRYNPAATDVGRLFSERDGMLADNFEPLKY